MVLYTTIEIDGNNYGINNGKVVSSTGDNNTTSNFDFTLMNYNGRYSSTFTIGNEVNVWIGTSVNPSITGTKIFSGLLEDIDIRGVLKGTIRLIGRDYSAELQDLTIPPEVYSNEEVSDIIDDLITKYAVNVTYNKVVTSVILERISFNQISLYDALKRLSDLTGYYFYVDASKVLQFKERSGISSGKLLNNNNVIKSKWKQTRKELANNVWVYGGTYFTGVRDEFISDGVGSVYNLSYKPHSLITTVSGVVYGGAIQDMISTAISGQQYLVNFNDKELILTSGAEAGDNLAASGVSIIAEYSRDTPIVKFGRDRESERAYGKKDKVIQDKNISDPNEAESKLKSQLDELSSPKREGTLNLEGIDTLNAGESIIVDLPEDNINNIEYSILEVTYDINKDSLLSEEVISVKLNKRISDFTDTVKNIILSIKDIQAGDIAQSETLTRLEFATGSIQLQPQWFVKTRGIGSSIVFDSTTRFSFDTPSGLATGSWFFDALSGVSFITQASGGIF